MFDNKKIFILGMARSGYQAARVLAHHGCEIVLNDKNENAFSELLVGREMDVLVEQEVNGKPNVFEGYTRNYVKVEIENADIINVLNKDAEKETKEKLQ